MKLSDKKGFEELLMASGMGIGQALAYLEPRIFAPVKQTRALAAELIRIAIYEEGAKAVFPLLLRFSSKRDQLHEQLMAVSKSLRDLILLKKSDDAPLIFYADRNEAIELCDRTSLGFLYRFHQAVQQAIEENSRNANTRLMLIKMVLSADLIA